jgi:hypothetical protein
MIQLSLPMRVAPASWTVPVEGDEFADGVAVADLGGGRLAGVLLVLRRRADGGELENLVVAPMVVWPSMTTCGPMRVPAPMRTSGPMTA